MTTTFGNRARQSSVKEETKSRSRKRTTKIAEGEPLPVRVVDCREGTTTRGTKMLHFDFQHLESKEPFPSTVFESIGPEGIDNQILEAVLPADMETYDLEDLIDGGFFATLKFNPKNDKIYINVVQVDPLDDHYQELLKKQLEQERQQHHQQEQEVEEFESEMGEFGEVQGSTKIQTSNAENNKNEATEEIELEEDEDSIGIDEDLLLSDDDSDFSDLEGTDDSEDDDDLCDKEE